MGGTGLVITATVLTGSLWLVNKFDFFQLQSILSQNLIYPFQLLWILAAVAILLTGGFFDDKYALSSKWLILHINLAIAVAVFAGGLKIEAFSYPFNELLPTFGWLPQILAYLWILLCVSAIKFLDGHDGLAGSASLITLLTIASVSLFTNVYQPLIFLFSIIWAVSILPFLWLNFPNAKLYLGEGGAECLGFIIGVLSILSGAKVATASTVIGWFILDVAVVFFMRFINKKPIFKADRTHWHHRLLSLGLNKIQVLIVTVIILLTSAHIGLLFPTEHKIYLLGAQGIVLISLFGLSVYLTKRNAKQLSVNQK